MKTISLLAVGEDNNFQTLVYESAQLAFHLPKVTALESLSQASLKSNHKSVDLIVLSSIPPNAIEKGIIEGAAEHLRDRVVIVMGEFIPIIGAELIPPEEWEKHLVARVLRSALERGQLKQQLHRFRGDLLTIGRRISHDFRTPLGGIVASAESLQESLSDVALTDATLTRAILESADDILKLIERISLLARASAAPETKKRLNMEISFLSALQNVTQRFSNHNGTITYPSVWPEVEGVEGWLQVIWENLLTNAICHRDSSTGIEAGWILSDCEHQFWVMDQGKGVAQEIQPLLFQPFHLLHQPNATRGMGLSMVRRLVELQGGHCAYEPMAKGGSRFIFTLPI